MNTLSLRQCSQASTAIPDSAILASGTCSECSWRVTRRVQSAKAGAQWSSAWPFRLMPVGASRVLAERLDQVMRACVSTRSSPALSSSGSMADMSLDDGWHRGKDDWTGAAEQAPGWRL